ncbi:MAG: YIP1 family protein [Nitrospirae bacterium]|nr:YIP1 family protein [Candidatus Manganitrophaceae bacterium]
MGQFLDRIIRAARLDVNLYEEVEADEKAMGQALSVVVLSSLAAGIGSLGEGGMARLLTGTVAALVGWYVWAFLTYMIGTKILPEPQTKSSHGELLRTIGFASAPGMIRILGFFPPVTGLIFLGASIWMLIAMIVAVRQALDYQSTLRAVGVCVIGWLIQILILIVVLAFGGGVAGSP